MKFFFSDQLITIKNIFSFSEDVGSINGIETISLKSRNSHPTQSQSEV
jgi:hypothetical protein